MARKVQVILTDDLDGNGADETVTFALDGTSYEIDLSAKNSKALRDAFAPYVGHARRVTKGRRSGASANGRSSATTDRAQTQAIRDWARRSGHQVSDRGRIPSAVLEAFNAAH
ncbi:MAG: Lsr2 family protein [Geodermatophilaceae bacterium]|nr:Lsr2 family protein [Geodermatophilaceae bacterium]